MAMKGNMLKSFEGKVRVWIGGLPQKGEWDDNLNEMLRMHMASTGLNCVCAQVGKNGMGGAAFSSQMEAEQAINIMNGTFFQGAIIQVDKLTKGNGSSGGSTWKPQQSWNNAGSNWGGVGVQQNQMMKMMQQLMMQKGMGKGGFGGGGKGGGKKQHIRGFDGKLRVWIGGLPQKGEPDDFLNKKLKEHMSSTGLNCVYAQVGKNGMGGAAFKTEQEAEQAIATMNGTIFEGAFIQVDRLTTNGLDMQTTAISSSPLLAQTQPATPTEVEEFLILNPVEQKAADQFRGMDARIQRLILDKGGLQGARDPTAAFIGRFGAVKKSIS